MDDIQHLPYHSLESFRPALIDQYLNTYTEDIIVQEKIHGSNIVIMGQKGTNGKWQFKLGSRKKWISDTDRFNNFQSLFKENEQSIIELFNNIINEHAQDSEIRLYGEIFGGTYGHQIDKGAFKTQTDPNYCPFNDFAFFDIYVNETCLPILHSIEAIEKYNLKVAPVIFKGSLSTFLKDFDIEQFKSVVSQQFYNLPFIDTPKSTEGVTIRTTSNSQSVQSEQSVILKYKQAWITENRRINKKTANKITDNSVLIESCLDMLNINRLDSYKSKQTIDDMTNPKILTTHVKNIVEDTIEDIQKEFPYDKYPELNIKEIKGKLSKKCFPMLKKYIKDLNSLSLPVEKRVQLAENCVDNLTVQLNMIKQRLAILNKRIM